MRDIYNIEPIKYPFDILPTYYSYIDETSYKSAIGDIVGKDLLSYIWAAYLNFSYWAEQSLRSVKALLTHNTNHDFITFDYPLYINNQDRRIENVASIGDIPGTRGDINVIPNGDMRIRAVNDSTIYTDYTGPGLWGWYRRPFYLVYDDEGFFDMPEYRIRNDNTYMIIPHKHDATNPNENMCSTIFEITKGGTAEFSIKAFAVLPDDINTDDVTVQLQVIVYMFRADGPVLAVNIMYFTFSATEREQIKKINIPIDTMSIGLKMTTQNLIIDGTSYDYYLWIKHISIKDGQLPDHSIKYDDTFVLEKPMLESKIYEVQLLNPMISKYWDYILGSNIINFTALSDDIFTWKESIATNLKVLWRPMVENSIYNLYRGVAAVAYSWFAPASGTVERVYPTSDNRIWDGSLIKLTSDNTTYYRRSILSPIYITKHGVNTGDLINTNLLNIIAPESAHIYTRVWKFDNGTISNVAGKDDLSPELKLKPHKFILFQYYDSNVMQSERFYEILKYGQRACPPGYRFLLTSGSVKETVHHVFVWQVSPEYAWHWDTTIQDIFVVSPATITISYHVGINNTDPTKTLVVSASLYDDDNNLISTNKETYEFSQTDYGKFFLVKVDLPVDAGNNKHIPYSGYIITSIDAYPAYYPGQQNATLIWEGPLVAIKREYWGNPQIRLWDMI